MTTHSIVAAFEARVAAFTNAPFAVAVDSCTNALFLCCKWLGAGSCDHITIPARTYCSVPQAVRQAGGYVNFDNFDWLGAYQLSPLPLFDAAKRFRRGMYLPGNYMCLSFHIKKNLHIGRGGMILHDNPRADVWFRAARHNGRLDGDTSRIPVMKGWDMWMTPEQAARGMWLMDVMPPHGFPDQTEDYPDLRQAQWWRDGR